VPLQQYYPEQNVALIVLKQFTYKSTVIMVVGPEDKIADVVFVVEGTANLGGYIDVLRDQYILPTLE